MADESEFCARCASTGIVCAASDLAYRKKSRVEVPFCLSKSRCTCIPRQEAGLGGVVWVCAPARAPVTGPRSPPGRGSAPAGMGQPRAGTLLGCPGPGRRARRSGWPKAAPASAWRSAAAAATGLQDTRTRTGEGLWRSQAHARSIPHTPPRRPERPARPCHGALSTRAVKTAGLTQTVQFTSPSLLAAAWGILGNGH